jgi:hypothetical protein
MRYCIASMPESVLLSSFPFPINRAAAFARKITGKRRKARVHNQPIMTELKAGYETPAGTRAADTLGVAHRWSGVAPH